MNGTDWACCWERTKALWPAFAKNVGPTMAEAWARQFKKFAREIVMDAIQLHFEERGRVQKWEYEPSNSRMYGLCMEGLRASGVEVADPVWQMHPQAKHRNLVRRLEALAAKGIVETPQIGNITNAIRNARKRMDCYEEMFSGPEPTGKFRLSTKERPQGGEPASIGEIIPF